MIKHVIHSCHSFEGLRSSASRRCSRRAADTHRGQSEIVRVWWNSAMMDGHPVEKIKYGGCGNGWIWWKWLSLWMKLWIPLLLRGLTLQQNATRISACSRCCKAHFTYWLPIDPNWIHSALRHYRQIKIRAKTNVLFVRERSQLCEA